MPGLLPDTDPNGLLEYSVVFTDRSLNHMSQAFQGVMNDISFTLKKVYNAKAVAVVPGGGTYVWKPWHGNLRMTRSVWLFAMAGLATAGAKFWRWEISPPKSS